MTPAPMARSTPMHGRMHGGPSVVAASARWYTDAEAVVSPEGEHFTGYLSDLPERARLFLESSPELALG